MGQSTSGENFGTPESFHWTLGQGMQPTGNIIAVAESRANAASHDGRVIVGKEVGLTPLAVAWPVSPSVAFRWTPETGAVDLGHLTPDGSSEATDVSANGRVVVGNSRVNTIDCDICLDGVATSAGDPGNGSIPQPLYRGSEPFRWTEETGMVGLGHLPFPETATLFADYHLDSIANGVSADGKTVVGRSSLVFASDAAFPFEPLTRAFRWTEQTGMQDLGTLDAPFHITSEVTAVDTNEDGSIIVGMTRQEPHPLIDSILPTFPRDLAFIWDERRGIRPLEDVLKLDYGIDIGLLGWELGEVAAISDDGSTIVGTGVNSAGQQEAWRLVLGSNYIAGDADFDGDVDSTDLAIVSRNQGKGGPGEAVYWAHGDFDADGMVSSLDLSITRATLESPFRSHPHWRC